MAAKWTARREVWFLAVLMLGSLSCSKTPLEEARLLGPNPGDRAKAESLAKEAFRVHTKEKDYAKAAALWLDTARADPAWWKPYYQLACLSALTGRKAESVEFLKIALGKKQSNEALRWMKTDSDLASVRDMPEFRALLGTSAAAQIANLAGDWGGAAPEVVRLLPPPYRDYRIPEYLSLEITAEGQFRRLGTSGRESGTITADGRKAHFTLNEAETEKKVWEGREIGGKTRIHRESAFTYALLQITHEGKQISLLCVEWEDANYASPTGGKQECYSKQ